MANLGGSRKSVERVLPAIGATLVLLSFFGQGQAEFSYVPLVDSALNLQETGRVEEANEILTAALATEHGRGNRGAQADLHFYIGLINQRGAERDSDTAAASINLGLALAHYDSALLMDSALASVYNNKALILERLGRVSEADVTFQHALACAGEKQQYFTNSYADFLLRQRSWQLACQLLGAIVLQDPENERMHGKCLDLYVKNNSGAITQYLDRLLGAQQVVRVSESAIQLLTDHKWPPRTKVELISLLTLALSRQWYEPLGFDSSEVGRGLAGLSDDPEVAPAAASLIRLHNAPSTADGDRMWWLRSWREFRPKYPCVPPPDCYRQLCRSLGRWYRDHGSIPLAAEYFRLAANLDEINPDPLAYMDIVDLYADAEDLEKEVGGLNPLEMFEGKGKAYARQDWRRVYEYHRALGLIFAYRGTWRNDANPPVAAEFQLEHALSTVKKVNRSGDSVANRMFVDPRVVHELANAYVRSNQIKKAETLIDNQLSEYRKYRQFRDAAQLLEDATKADYSNNMKPATTQRWAQTLDTVRVDASTMAVEKPSPLPKLNFGGDAVYVGKLSEQDVRAELFLIEPTSDALDAGAERLSKKEQMEAAKVLVGIAGARLRETDSGAVVSVVAQDSSLGLFTEVRYQGGLGVATWMKEGRVVEVPFYIRGVEANTMKDFHILATRQDASKNQVSQSVTDKR